MTDATYTLLLETVLVSLLEKYPTDEIWCIDEDAPPFAHNASFMPHNLREQIQEKRYERKNPESREDYHANLMQTEAMKFSERRLVMGLFKIGYEEGIAKTIVASYARDGEKYLDAKTVRDLKSI